MSPPCTPGMHGSLNGFIFDIDGVLLHGDTPVPGAVETVRKLARAGYAVAYLSNNSASTSAACAERLARHGFPATEKTALTAAMVAAQFATTYLADKDVVVVGMPAMLEAFEQAGVKMLPLERADQADAMIMGRDEAFTYDRLVVLMRTARRLGAFFATGLDARLPVGNGQFVPGAGAMITAVAYASGVRPQVLGKPAATAAEAAAGALGLPAAEVAVVGDSLTEDIAMGHAVGMHTVLVLSGTATAADVAALPADDQPTVVLQSVSHLPGWLARCDELAGPARLDRVRRVSRPRAD